MFARLRRSLWPILGLTMLSLVLIRSAQADDKADGKAFVDARLLLQAISLGKPIKYVSPEEAEALGVRTAAEERGSSHGNDRIWQMWIDEASGKTPTQGQ